MQTSTIQCRRCGNENLSHDPETSRQFCGVCGFVPYSRLCDVNSDSELPSPSRPHVALDTGSMLHIDKEGNFGKWLKIARISDQSDKNYATGLWQIFESSCALALSKEIVESAALFLKDAFKKRTAKGRSISALCGAALYAACRINGTTKTVEEIAIELGTDKRKVAQCLQVLVGELHLTLPRFDLDDYCNRILKDLRAGHATIQMAEKLRADLGNSRNWVGKDPRGISAAIAYLASKSTGEILTQREISRVSNVTETTLRNRYREIKWQIEASKIA